MTIEEIKSGIIYEDKHILVCRKPAGFPVQTRKINLQDMETLLLSYLTGKGEAPYLAVIHRLDQPVEGILVFGKTKEAAKELNKQMQNNQMEKYYLAAVRGIPERKEGRLENYLLKNGRTNTSEIVTKNTPQSKKAVLEYKVLKEKENAALLEIHLLTGRHHQIRVQMAGAGYPLLGDVKYNAFKEEDSWKQIGVCAYRLSFYHPYKKKKMEFSVDPSGGFCQFAEKNVD